MLNDPNLFEGSAELTTKEILKRYGEIGKHLPPPQSVTPPSASRSATRPAHGRPGNLVAQDPHSWPAESSVRPVGGPGYVGASQIGGGGHSSQYGAPSPQYGAQLPQSYSPGAMGQGGYASPPQGFQPPYAHSQPGSGHSTPRQGGFTPEMTGSPNRTSQFRGQRGQGPMMTGAG